MKVTQPGPITDLLSSTKRTFEIPVYQRNYVWKVEDCEKLFDDVLEGVRSNKDHYFGNIVYFIDSIDPITGFVRYILIDGQQRITSTMLLLAAIRDEETDIDTQEGISKTYLKNEGVDDELRIKLKQIETDRTVYEKIIEGRSNDIDTSSVIYRNYKKFRNMVKAAKKDMSYTSAEIIGGIRHLNIIGIDLESNSVGSESPQVIFESINATGEPLSTADLLRNFLLLEIGTEKQVDYYKNYWLVIEKNIGNENISDYIRRYLTLKSAEDIKKDTEYKEFKKNYRDYFDSAEEAINELTHFSTYYRWIKRPEVIGKQYPDTSVLLQDLDDLRMLPATPAIMWLLERADRSDDDPERISFEDVNNTFSVIAAWSFRARITNIINTGEIGNILTTKILQLLQEKKSDESYADYLWFELSNYRARDIYPSDEMFKEAFIRYDFYKNYRRYVQQKLAAAVSNDQTEVILESIEHIMPQSLKEHKWPGITVSEHAEWVNTIGNLTPLNMIDNPAASNGSYEDKKQYIGASDWQITRDIVKNYETWGIKNIQDRAAKLADKATSVWRAPAVRTREIELVRKTGTSRTDKFVGWLEEFDLPYIRVDEDRISNAYLRLNTDYMDKLFPARETPNGKWKNGKAYYYELRCDANGDTTFYLVFNATDMSEEQKQAFIKVTEFVNRRPPKEDWTWFNAINWPTNDEEGEETQKADFERIVSVEIPRFEHELAASINNDSNEAV